MSGAIADNGESLVPWSVKRAATTHLERKLPEAAPIGTCVLDARMSILVQGGVYGGRQ
jgi:hypothetical protein